MHASLVQMKYIFDKRSKNNQGPSQKKLRKYLKSLMPDFDVDHIGIIVNSALRKEENEGLENKKKKRIL